VPKTMVEVGDVCLTCGHDRQQHLAADAGKWAGHCAVFDCACTALVQGRGAPAPPTDPPDLDAAVHAATRAIHERNLHDQADDDFRCACDADARVAVEAAWPHIQATRDRLADLKAQVDELERLRTYAVEMDAALNCSNDPNEVLVNIVAAHSKILKTLKAIRALNHAAAPDRGRQVLDELDRLRHVIEDYIAEYGALEPWEWAEQFGKALDPTAAAAPHPQAGDDPDDDDGDALHRLVFGGGP